MRDLTAPGLPTVTRQRFWLIMRDREAPGLPIVTGQRFWLMMDDRAVDPVHET